MVGHLFQNDFLICSMNYLVYSINHLVYSMILVFYFVDYIFVNYIFCIGCVKYRYHKRAVVSI